jgi:hypothetical protein
VGDVTGSTQRGSGVAVMQNGVVGVGVGVEVGIGESNSESRMLGKGVEDATCPSA